MRISTNQIYDSGIRGMQTAQSAVYKSQNQIAADRRVLKPSDDPIAAAQAVVVSQSKSVNAQYQVNQQSAKNQLALVDKQLSAVTDALQNVRGNLVKAGSTATLTSDDRESIADELESNLSELMGLANGTDAQGDYLFSGYQGDTQPFALDAAGEVQYQGDAGLRRLQVSAARQIGVSVSGYDVFMDGKNGNGTFSASTGGVVDISGGTPGAMLDSDGNPIEIVNQGSATISAGSVSSQQKWTNALNDTDAGLPIQIVFSTDAASGELQYQIYDTVGGLSAAQTYVDGQAISLVTANGVDFGAQVVISGTPYGGSATLQNGDSFTISPSTPQSVFTTIQNAITALRTGIETSDDPATAPANYTSTQMLNDISAQLGNVDLAMENVATAQSLIGSNAKEVEDLTSTSEDVAILYASTLSDLRDLDYTEAYSTYTKQQVTLQAAQQSFMKMSGKSLFDYL